MNRLATRSADGFVYATCPSVGCATRLRIKPKAPLQRVSCTKCGSRFTLNVTKPALAKDETRNSHPSTTTGQRGTVSRVTHKDRRLATIALVGLGCLASLLLVAGLAAGSIYLLRDREAVEPMAAAAAEMTPSPEPAISSLETTEPPAEIASNFQQPTSSETRTLTFSKPAADKPRAENLSTENEAIQPAQARPKKSSPKKNPGVARPASGSKEILERVKKSTCLIEAKSGWGTGFVIRPGIVMTNAHVISGKMIQELRVSFVSLNDTAPAPHKATLLYFDKRRDLAILRVDTDRPALEFTSSETTLRGMEVAVVGNPKGDGGQAEINKVTTGKLSAPIRRDAGWTYFELQAQAYFGNSGGPVVDLKTGKVAGVMQSILGDGKYKSYCIPHGEALRALNTLPATKELEPAVTKIALGRHYLDFIAGQLPGIEKNADLAMQGQLERLRSRGDDVTVTVTTVDGRRFNMSLAELMTEMREKYAETYLDIKKALPIVTGSPEISTALKRVLRERIESCSHMRTLASARTNLETTFRREMLARKSMNDKKAKEFDTAYEKYLDELERKPVGK